MCPPYQHGTIWDAMGENAIFAMSHSDKTVLHPAEKCGTFGRGMCLLRLLGRQLFKTYGFSPAFASTDSSYTKPMQPQPLALRQVPETIETLI